VVNETLINRAKRLPWAKKSGASLGDTPPHLNDSDQQPVPVVPTPAPAAVPAPVVLPGAL
jgi:hypothetical protein